MLRVHQVPDRTNLDHNYAYEAALYQMDFYFLDIQLLLPFNICRKVNGLW